MVDSTAFMSGGQCYFMYIGSSELPSAAAARARAACGAWELSDARECEVSFREGQRELTS